MSLSPLFIRGKLSEVNLILSVVSYNRQRSHRHLQPALHPAELATGGKWTYNRQCGHDFIEVTETSVYIKQTNDYWKGGLFFTKTYLRARSSCCLDVYKILGVHGHHCMVWSEFGHILTICQICVHILGRVKFKYELRKYIWTFLSNPWKKWQELQKKGH